MACPTHGQQQGTASMLSDGWSPARCPECARDLQQASEQRAKAQPWRAVRRDGQRDAADRLERSGIPPRFAGKTFDAFTARTFDQQAALQACRAFAEGFEAVRRHGRCIMLCGVPGTGKTHLACAILDHVTRHFAAEGRYLSFAKAIRSVKQTYSKASPVTEQQAIDALCRPDMLVLDEIGVQFGSEAEKMIGFEIINARYEAMKPTVIVSNLSARELETCLGDRVVDRLCENGGEMVIFRGESARTAQP